MTTRYLSEDEFLLWARDEIVTDLGLVGSAIAAAEELLDFEAKRSLQVITAATAASARSFVPDVKSDVLRVFDADEVTSVVENGVTLTADVDFQLEPIDQLHPSTGGYRPYDTIRRLDACWYTDGPRATVTVTAKWGWSTIPSVVVEACKILAADWLEHRNVRLGVVGSTVDGFSIGVRSSPAVTRAVAAIAGPKSLGIA